MNKLIKHDITLQQGQDYEIDLIYANDDETPIDVTGWTALSYIRQKPHSLDYFPFTCTADTSGFHLTMDKTLTDEIPFTKGVYDVIIINPDNNKKTPLIIGEVTIKPRSTR